MNRGRAAALRWRRAYWSRVSPGALGGVVYVLLPALFFAPLEALILFEDRSRGTLAVLWCLCVALGMVVGTGRGAREEDSVWLFQKGVPLGDVALEDWVLDVALLACACAWWSAVGALALVAEGSLSRSAGALFLFGFPTAVLARTLSGFFSAWGARRPGDLTGAFAFISLLLPLLVTGRPPLVQHLVTWVTPPFLEAGTFSGALRGGDWEEGAGALLHILLFTGLLLAGTFWGVSRWRPKG